MATSWRRPLLCFVAVRSRAQFGLDRVEGTQKSWKNETVNREIDRYKKSLVDSMLSFLQRKGMWVTEESIRWFSGVGQTPC